MANKKKVVMRVKRKESKKTISPTVQKQGAKGKFNLIATFNPNHYNEAANELQKVLVRIGEKPKIGATESDGIYKVAVSDARKVVGRLHKLCQADPDLFAVTYRYIPVDVWCKSEVGAMQKCIKKEAKGIGEAEKWKLSLHKRLWDRIPENKLILKLTDVVDLDNTDLENPQKIVQVEIIGKEAGVSLITPDERLNIAKLKE